MSFTFYYVGRAEFDSYSTTLYDVCVIYIQNHVYIIVPQICLIQGQYLVYTKCSYSIHAPKSAYHNESMPFIDVLILCTLVVSTFLQETV